MQLTTAQLQTLKTAINADQELAAYPVNSDGALDLSRKLDDLASPDFIVWKSDVKWDDIMTNGMDWARVDNLSVGKSRIWEWMFDNDGRTINAGKPNIRTGIESVWVGTAADLAVRAAVYVHCKRKATRGEKILATGTGSDASPATMGWEGTIDPNDILAARTLP